MGTVAPGRRVDPNQEGEVLALLSVGLPFAYHTDNLAAKNGSIMLQVDPPQSPAIKVTTSSWAFMDTRLVRTTLQRLNRYDLSMSVSVVSSVGGTAD